MAGLLKKSQMFLPQILTRQLYKTYLNTAKGTPLLTDCINQQFIARQCPEIAIRSVFSFIAHPKKHNKHLITGTLQSASLSATVSMHKTLLNRGHLFNRRSEFSHMSVRLFKTDSEGGSKRPAADDIPAWVVKLNNENGYLSWCRNTYILTIAAATIYTQDVFVPFAKETGLLLVFVGGVNLVFGTVSYLHNIVWLARNDMISVWGVVPTFAIGVFHVLMWFCAMAIYLGYIEEVEEEEEGAAHRGDDVKDKKNGGDKLLKGRKE